MGAFSKDQEAELEGIVKDAIVSSMPALPETASADEIKVLREQNASLNEKMDALLKHMQDTPAVRSAGYYTDDGGDADKKVQSFGDFLIAVMRGDTKRLTHVYKSRKVQWEDEVKDVQAESGPAGGYLIPDQFIPRLLELAAPLALVRPRAAVIPVASLTGRIPALNQYTAPTAGQGDSAFYGGVVASWTGAGGTLTETQPTFAEIEYNIRKMAGYTEVEAESLADSAIGIEALLSRLFAGTKAGMEDYAFLRGNGVGKPLGVLNGAAAIGIAPATNNAFAYADALSMRARFKGAGGSPVWAIHPGIWPDIGVFEVSSGSGGVWIANLAGSMPQTILGWPIVESEHLPQDDNSGAVILGDFSAYVIFDRQQMAVAYSEHAAFTTDKGTWKFTARLDGQPWVKGAVTLADPQGSYTVSPFVYHND